MKKGRQKEFSRVRTIQLAMQGLTQREISEKLGCTQGTVCRNLKQLYISPRSHEGKRPEGIMVKSRRKFITPFILMLHDQGHNMKEIQEIVGSSPTLVRSVLLKEGRDTSQKRGHAISMHRRYCEQADRLADFLEGYGPQHLKPLRLGRSLHHHIKRDNRFRFLKFSIGLGRFSTSRPVRRLADGRCSVPINGIAATDDPRIPEWLAAQVPWRLRGSGEAAAIMRRLRNRIGREAAAITIVLLGYHYETTPLKGLYSNTQWAEKQRALVGGGDDGGGCMHRAFGDDSK